MKRFFKIMAAALIMLTGVLLLTACGDSHDEALVGTWRWEADPSGAITTTFNSDGTGSHSMDWSGYGTTFNWRTSGRNIIWSYPGFGDVTTRYTVSDEVWTFTMADGTVFRYLRD